jgi:hypothetical protein
VIFIRYTDIIPFYIRLNANCPVAEKSGKGPGSCGGKVADSVAAKNKCLDLAALLGKAKVPKAEPTRLSSSYKDQSTISGIINEGKRLGLDVKIVGMKDEHNMDLNRVMTTAVYYRENFPELNTSGVIITDASGMSKNSKTVAKSVRYPDGTNVIMVSAPKLKDRAELKRIMMKSASPNPDTGISWHPPGCNTIQSVIDHEMGHELEKAYRLLADGSDVKKILEENIHNGMQVSFKISDYAATNYPDEAIPELWSKYRNSPDPRPLAEAVGEAIMKRAKGSRGSI